MKPWSSDADIVRNQRMRDSGAKIPPDGFELLGNILPITNRKEHEISE